MQIETSLSRSLCLTLSNTGLVAPIRQRESDGTGGYDLAGESAGRPEFRRGLSSVDSFGLAIPFVVGR
ncbi:unnamed protein product [Linum trigynum]|uniref:Uncharacterized protein n=1 Tax=Linum trigynum TaxID=586398 RepID=A0AAV2F9L6_9ROSI